LQGLIDRLDYVQALGVDAIWLSPFFRSPQRDFGYDISDYCDVAPEYGTLETWDRLVAAAHARGVKLVIDGVFKTSIPGSSSRAPRNFASVTRTVPLHATSVLLASAPKVEVVGDAVQVPPLGATAVGLAAAVVSRCAQ
jgi:hypothetical protein